MQNVFCKYNCYQNVLLIKIRNVDFYMIHILTENHLKNNNFTPCTQRVVKGARWPFRQSVRQYIISLGKHLRIYWASLVFVVIKSIKLYICAYLQDIPTRSRTGNYASKERIDLVKIKYTTKKISRFTWLYTRTLLLHLLMRRKLWFNVCSESCTP